jgi:DNA polymerase III subunit chi
VQVDFYHLTGAPVERVLPRIAERVLQEGGRLLVVSADDALSQRLDDHLWNYRPDSFLPHGRAGKPGEADQPVLIADTSDPLNGARNLALADGVWRDESLSFERVFLLFGDDRIANARAAWRALGERDGVDRRFWKQDEAGKWSRER